MKIATSAAGGPGSIVENSWQDVGASFERFCLTAGIVPLSDMLENNAVGRCDSRYGRAVGKGSASLAR
jgi:putative transposase